MSGEEFPDSQDFTWQSRRQNSCPPDLRLLHYNDVYHIEYVEFEHFQAWQREDCTNEVHRAGSAEPVGGISRFQTVVNHYRSDPQYKDQVGLLTLFSGDAFNPSLESSVTKGRHMVPVLNNLGTAMACVGVSMEPFSFTCSYGGSLSLLTFSAVRIMI